MKSRMGIVVVVLAMLGLAGLAQAEDKEVTLKGKMTCAKCSLKQTEKCQNALIVTEDGKEVTYLLADNEVSKAAHEGVCKTTKEDVSVTGVVSEADGKKIITPTKISS
jgi:hypothetical protein